MLNTIIIILIVIITIYLLLNLLAKIFNTFTKLFYFIHDAIFSLCLMGGLNQIFYHTIGLNIFINICTAIVAIIFCYGLNNTRGAYCCDKGYTFACAFRIIYMIFDCGIIGYLINTFVLADKPLIWKFITYIGLLLGTLILSENAINIKRFEDTFVE